MASGVGPGEHGESTGIWIIHVLSATPRARARSAILRAVATTALGPPQRAWIRPLLISVGYFQFQFPQIVAFLPAATPAR